MDMCGMGAFRVAQSWMEPEWKVRFPSGVMYRCQSPQGQLWRKQQAQLKCGIRGRNVPEEGELRTRASSCSAGQLLLPIITGDAPNFISTNRATQRSHFYADA